MARGAVRRLGSRNGRGDTRVCMQRVARTAQILRTPRKIGWPSERETATEDYDRQFDKRIVRINRHVYDVQLRLKRAINALT